MNENFRKAASAVKALKQKASGLYGALGAFVCDIVMVGDSTNGYVQVLAGTDIKPAFKEQEQMASVEMKVHFGKDAPSTYRVVKALFVNAVAKGVPITENGKLRGKTAIEADLDALKTEKSELEKFKTSMNTATAIADKLPAHDRITAAALAQELLNKLAATIELAA